MLLLTQKIAFAGTCGTYITQWGSNGSGNGQLNQPQGLVVDASGNIFVAEAGNNRIQKFDSNGNYLSQWGSFGSAPGQFNGPQGIAMDSGGDIYVADSYNNRIQEFNSSGGFIAAWGSVGSASGQLNYPQGIAVDSSGNVYVADTNNSRVQKFSSSGSFLAQLGSSGSGTSQILAPTYLAVDGSGNVYVVDYGNARIEKFDSSGNYVTEWGSSGSGSGQFNDPRGIAVDANGDVFVAEIGNSRVQEFDSNGNFLAQWGVFGSGNGQFNYPYGVAVDGSGNVYVADSSNSRIQKFSCTGSSLSPTPTSTISPTLTVTLTPAPGCLAGNLLVNPGFESGFPAGWTVSNNGMSDSQKSWLFFPSFGPHSGDWYHTSGGAAAGVSGTSLSMSQTLSGLPDCSYEVGVWVFSDYGTICAGTCYTSYPVDSYLKVSNYGGPPVTLNTYPGFSDTWLYFSLTVTVSTGTLQVELGAQTGGFFSTNNQAAIDWDDASVLCTGNCASPTPSFTPSPTPSISPILTATGTATPGPSLTRSLTVTPTGSVTLSATQTPLQTPTPSPMNNAPESFKIISVYPNPVPGTGTSILVSVPVASEVEFKVYSVRGELLWTALQSYSAPGSYAYHWGAMNQAGMDLSYGAYFLRAKLRSSGAEFSDSRWLAILR